jgi:hypothetical protein
MYFATVLLCHVLGAIGVGPIFTLPFLAKTPTALHAVLVLLRFGAGATLVSGVLEPAIDRSSDELKMRGRVRWAGIASSALVLCIAALMVLRPGES